MSKKGFFELDLQWSKFSKLRFCGSLYKWVAISTSHDSVAFREHVNIRTLNV